MIAVVLRKLLGLATVSQQSSDSRFQFHRLRNPTRDNPAILPSITFPVPPNFFCVIFILSRARKSGDESRTLTLFRRYPTWPPKSLSCPRRSAPDTCAR